jgi:hypothetical protein
MVGNLWMSKGALLGVLLSADVKRQLNKSTWTGIREGSLAAGRKMHRALGVASLFWPANRDLEWALLAKNWTGPIDALQQQQTPAFVPTTLCNWKA